MSETLLTIFPRADDLLALEPEDLGDVILSIVPGVMQPAGFTIEALKSQLFLLNGRGYPPGIQTRVVYALAEALSRLITFGLIIEEPGQPGHWYRPTRRAAALTSQADVQRFRKSRILPVELLQPALAEKVWPLFLRGDHDVAVFQAFKEIEVATRKRSNAKGAEYSDDLVGVPLMRKAFHPETGPLANPAAVTAEREAEMHLFSGAIGHAKNPVSHREVNLPPQEAARLVVLASHLLSIVEQR